MKGIDAKSVMNFTRTQISEIDIFRTVFRLVQISGKHQGKLEETSGIPQGYIGDTSGIHRGNLGDTSGKSARIPKANFLKSTFVEKQTKFKIWT